MISAATPSAMPSMDTPEMNEIKPLRRDGPPRAGVAPAQGQFVRNLHGEKETALCGRAEYSTRPHPRTPRPGDIFDNTPPLTRVPMPQTPPPLDRLRRQPRRRLHPRAATPAPAHLERLLAQLGRSAPEPRDKTATRPCHTSAPGAGTGPAQPGPRPWAAWESRTLGQPCAWITPCHWQAGADQVPDAPAGDWPGRCAKKRALLAIVALGWRKTASRFTYHAPLRWLACGSALADLHTASLERVQGRDAATGSPGRASTLATAPAHRAANAALQPPFQR